MLFSCNIPQQFCSWLRRSHQIPLNWVEKIAVLLCCPLPMEKFLQAPMNRTAMLSRTPVRDLCTYMMATCSQTVAPSPPLCVHGSASDFSIILMYLHEQPIYCDHYVRIKKWLRSIPHFGCNASPLVVHRVRSCVVSNVYFWVSVRATQIRAARLSRTFNFLGQQQA